MGEIVAFAFGLAVALLGSRLLRGRPPEEPLAVTSQEPSEFALPVANPVERLLALSAAMSGIGDASAHPRDLAVRRTFFAERVIGQDEAVDAVVDQIAMLKAGLTDPGRPTACSSSPDRPERARPNWRRHSPNSFSALPIG